MKGMVISTVGWLILAIVGLVVLFIFLSQLVPAVGQFMDAVVRGIRKQLCRMLGCGPGLQLGPWCWAFCSGGL